MAVPGEVRLVWFPFSRHEPQPYKKRPVLVLATAGTTPDQAVLVEMITGNPARFARPHPGDVPIRDWQAIGLVKESVVRTRRIWTAEDRDLDKVLGTVDAQFLDTVRAQLRALLT